MTNKFGRKSLNGESGCVLCQMDCSHKNLEPVSLLVGTKVLITTDYKPKTGLPLTFCHPPRPLLFTFHSLGIATIQLHAEITTSIRVALSY